MQDKSCFFSMKELPKENSFQKAMQLFSLNLGSSSFSFFLLTSLLFQVIQTAIALSANVTSPAVLVFGDSIVDTGNNNKFATLAKCNFPPYGRDFLGGKPTGRFSNGKVPSDLIGTISNSHLRIEYLGIKELLPAYLDTNLKTEDLLTGVNFASGGAGYDPLTPKIETAIPLSEQLKLFKQYIGELKAATGEERAKTIVSESLYLVCAGSNDIFVTYFSTPFRKFKYDVSSYTDLMVSLASSFVLELYGMGARKILVLNVPPVGCVPAQRTLAGGIERGCVEEYNQAVVLFNSKLSSQLNRLNNQLPQATVLYVDIYYPVLDLILKPSVHGFEEVTKGCCGTGKIEATILCNDNNPFTCTDVSKYVFWDSFHPTEKAYKVLFDSIFQTLGGFL